MKFVELFYPRNYLRFLKKGLFFALLLYFLGRITKFALSLFGIVLNAETIKQASSMPGKSIAIMLVAIIISYILIGFTTEFVNHPDSNNKFLKWINK